MTPIHPLELIIEVQHAINYQNLNAYDLKQNAKKEKTL